jgi:hypothetical protein
VAAINGDGCKRLNFERDDHYSLPELPGRFRGLRGSCRKTGEVPQVPGGLYDWGSGTKGGSPSVTTFATVLWSTPGANGPEAVFGPASGRSSGGSACRPDETASGWIGPGMALGGGFLFFPLLIVAIVLGKTDLKQMDQGLMDPSGRGMTQTGVVLGYVFIVVTVIGAIVLMFYCSAMIVAIPEFFG